MLPKRKFIKKIHRRPEEPNEQSNTHPGTLLQRLRSGDPTHIEEALAYISSMCTLSGTSEPLPLLAELIAILHRGPTAAVYQSLYALSNLAEIDSAIVPQLFQLGLHKALLQLNSGDALLLKPILSLMTVLHGVLPQQFKYLEVGIEQSLSITHLQSNAKEQVLTYLLRIESSSLRQEIYGKLFEFFKNEQRLRIRSLCVGIIMRNKVARAKLIKEILQYCQEILCDIDLQKEYNTNILHLHTSHKPKEVDTDMIDQEEEVYPAEHPNQETFNDAVEAVETLLEALLILFEEGTNQPSLEEEQCEEDWNNEIEVQAEQFSQTFLNFLTEKSALTSRNIMLSFFQGQNIVHLSLRVLGYCKAVDKSVMGMIIVKCFENTLVVKPPEQIQQQILLVGLHLLLKCPLPPNARNLFLILAENVLPLSHSYRDSWLCLLEIYSQQFNPQKSPVNEQQNRRVGAILKHLIINIPQLNLEEWRCQAIDTVFDAFSNENFDKYLMELGLLELLEKVIHHAGNGKKKRFVREVITDIQRFLEYKRKMIKF